MTIGDVLAVTAVGVAVAVVIRYRPLERVVVYDYQRGVLYRRGRRVRTLEAGVYWIVRAISSIVTVDVRSRVAVVAGQEILTADSVPLRVSVTLRYRVARPEEAIETAASFTDTLHAETQLVLRDLVAAIPIELLDTLPPEQIARILAALRPIEALADELRAAHAVEVLVVPCDLADGADRRDLCVALREGSRSVVGVCNNAGFGLYGRAAEQDPERLQEMVELNVDAVHALTLAFLPGMLERGEGAILNVASLAGFQPVPSMATYAATKAFVQSFSEALHAELAGTGVSCTVLAPGPVPTEFGAVAGTDEIGSLVPGFVTEPPEEVAAAAVRGMLRGRRSVVPGTATKALATGGRYVPRSLLLPAARRARRGGDKG